MLRLLLIWLLNGVSLLLVAELLPGVAVTSLAAALGAALLLGLINTLLRPLLVLLTLPATLLSLGLFLFIINGLLFWLGGSLIQGFVVEGFWSGFFGAMLYSLVSWALTSALTDGRRGH